VLGGGIVTVRFRQIVRGMGFSDLSNSLCADLDNVVAPGVKLGHVAISELDRLGHQGRQSAQAVMLRMFSAFGPDKVAIQTLAADELHMTIQRTSPEVPFDQDQPGLRAC
jgi:hypothetical protein